LHTVASAHDVPLATAVLTQPDAVLQLSVVHTLASLQLSAAPGVHRPAWHVSAPLQALPSVHDVPSGADGLAHEPALQTSDVQGSPSAQSAFTMQA
jgi:hypothetical protein